MKKEDLIIKLHEIGAIKFGQFTLKSGIVSPIYIDLRILVSYPKILKEVAAIYAQEIKGTQYDRLAAVPYAAIPIATAISLLINKPLIYTRKEVKDHGLIRPVEGEYKKGDQCLLIEDLVTTGSSILETVELLTSAGIKVKDVAFLLDREQGGLENLKKAGYRVHYVFGMSQMLGVLLKKRKINHQQFKEVKEFLNKSQAKS